jgi:protein-S-isoprenylcysteine O-methyltransferase Ste14
MRFANLEALMQRWCYFAYGVFGHLLFLATYAYLAGFVGNLLVPKSIDSAPQTGWWAVGVDIALIALFGLQHTIMARPGFKRMWTRVVPEPIERSTYMLLSCVCLALLVWQWRGLDAVVWNVQHPLGRGLLWGLFAAGWLMVPAVTLLISHTDLFGLRQVWLHLRGRPYTPLPFRTPSLYARMRHPMYVGWFIAFWATPTMTLGHLLFAASMTLYIAIAVRYEERDLVTYFGDAYRSYQRRVPMFVPRLIEPVASPVELPEIPQAAYVEPLAK